MAMRKPIFSSKSATPGAALASLFALGLLLAVVNLRLRPPAPLSIDAPTECFSALRAKGYLQELLYGATSHPMGSSANKIVRDRIVAILREFDCEVEIQKEIGVNIALGRVGPVENILVRLPGKNLDSAILFVAHYDSVGAGPGASDDGSGVAALLELARIFKLHGPFENSVIFLFSDGEEAGLLGAEAFVAEHLWADQVKTVINLEARGTSGPSLLVETSENNAWLLKICAHSVKKLFANSLSYTVYKLLPNDTDLTVFKRGGYSGLFFAFIDNLVHYHTPLDKIENLNLGSLQHQGENALAVGRALADTDFAQKIREGDSVYSDIFGLFVIRWPESWTAPLAIASSLILLTAIALLVRKRALKWFDCVAGALVWLLILLASALLGYCLTWAIEILNGSSSPWRAHPLPTRILLWALVPLTTGALISLCFRKTGFWGLFSGAWIVWNLLSLAGALLAPGASVVLLIPAMVASGAILSVAAVYGKNNSLMEFTICLVALLVAGYFCFILAIFLEMTFGLSTGAAVTVPLSLLGGIWASFLRYSAKPSRVLGAITFGSGGIVLISLITAVLMPSFSEDRPVRLNINYVLDHENTSAHWFVGGTKAVLPESMRQEGDFTKSGRQIFPWLLVDSLRFSAPAQTIPIAPPELNILKEEVNNSRRLLETQLILPGGATNASFHIPANSPLKTLEVGGKEISFSQLPEYSGYRILSLVGFNERKVVIGFTLSGEQSLNMRLIAMTPGLPGNGATLIEARPATHVPSREGDMTVVYKRLEI